MRFSRALALLSLAGAMAIMTGPARADRFLNDMWDNGTVIRSDPVFPNWDMVHLGSFDIQFVDNNQGPENIRGMTVVNFGTAGGGDIENLYWIITGGGVNCKGTSLQTMTYVGLYAVYDSVAENLPAWTWTGNYVDLSNCEDLGGGTIVTLDLYADIAPCPTDGSTIKLGLPVNKVADPIWPGSISDYHADLTPTRTTLPWANTTAQLDTPILYVYKKVDRNSAAPADTLTYKLYYGRPGTADISQIEIIDSLPSYTHYVGGSAVPAPDVGWAPNPGPPLMLRWTIPGPIPVAGGLTSEVSFQLTIDWGNGEAFEPGSGNVAAPEGSRLVNRAAAYYSGPACSVGIAPLTSTVVRRFLFWMLGTNDLLFSSSIGEAPDEIIYSIYIRNLSSKKGWYDISLWDTVPDELNVWDIDCGFDDPLIGWTMTPTGAAPGFPKPTVVGGNTILDWRLDMLPDATIELRWKAKVKPTAPGGSQAMNKISLLAFGRPNTVNGTGSSIIPKGFTHLAPIALPTTYISYVAYSAQIDDGGPGFFIDFFPLNRKTQFQLFGVQYDGTSSFVTNGGVSDTISCQIGDCIGGFGGNSGCTLGSGAIPGGGRAGCGGERVPAVYDPLWTPPIAPFNFIYKVVSNSPLVWQLLTHVSDCNQDRQTYAPSSTINYRGWLHYTWPGDFTGGSTLTLINTGVDGNLNFNPDLATTAHLFKYDYSSKKWQYNRTYELGPEAVAAFVMQGPDTFPATSPDFVPWRIISSDTALIVNVGSYTFHNTDCCCCQGGDNFSSYEPSRETGLTVTPVDNNGDPLPATTYGMTNDWGCGSYLSTCVVGNVGSIDASFDIYLYMPLSTLGAPEVPTLLRNTEGLWRKIGSYTVPAGVGNPGNPINFNPGPFGGYGSAVHKIVLKSGGPIQTTSGTDTFSGWAGGGVIHSADGRTMGTEFWINMPPGWLPGGGKGCWTNTHTVDVFSPKAGTIVTGESEETYFSQFVTSGPDQCVKFIELTNPPEGSKMNWIFKADGADVIAVYNQCTQTEKGFTAPFLETGVHYAVITPPVVFSGQKFWITVVVLGAGNITKGDYCGTSLFTATDPSTLLEGVPMGLYEYDWTSDLVCDSGGMNDNGIRLFTQASMNVPGPQTIVVSDRVDGSIAGLGSLLVVIADIKFWKEPPYAVRASGDTVQFRICWSNYSSASGVNFTVTDRIPNGMTYIPDTVVNHFCGSTYGVLPGVALAYSTTDNQPNSFTTTTANPPLDITWLRWTVPEAGVKTTGCVCFQATVQ